MCWEASSIATIGRRLTALIASDEVFDHYTVHELSKDKKGSYRIVSATDPDATYRVHGDQIDFGYTINVAATDTFIRETHADTGCRPDAAAIPELLVAQQEHHNLTPSKYIYDKAAGTSKWHAAVAKVTDEQTQLVAPLVAYDRPSQRLGPDDSTLSADGLSLTCPMILGHTSLEVTQMYLHLAEAHAQVQHNRFSPVNRLGLKDS